MDTAARATARGRAVIGAKAEADATQAAARTERYMMGTGTVDSFGIILLAHVGVLRDH